MKLTEGPFEPNEHEVKEIIEAPEVHGTGMFVCPNLDCHGVHVAVMDRDGKVLGHMVIGPEWLMSFFEDGMRLCGHPVTCVEQDSEDETKH